VYFLHGGMNKSTSHVSKKTYVYFPKDNKAYKLANATLAKYTFNLVYH